MAGPVDGRVAFVTAGAQGIGRAISTALVRDGWTVAALDVDAEALEDLAATLGPDLGGGFLALEGDAGAEEVIAGCIEHIVERFGRLDAIVNNAGINANGPIEDLDLDAVRRVLDINVLSILASAKHGAKPLRASGHGAIVNIASTRALMSEPDTEAYSASKGAVLAVTHALAASLGTRDDHPDRPPIRVNCISPGWIETGAWQKPSARRTPEHSATDRRQHPAGRVGTPEDIAAAVLYLLSKGAGFVTGQNITVDGGMTRKMIYKG
jgi:NAD(P)-dependent dehydrogenase (short-subunit alcohol dehydrogenase family)